MNLSNFDLLFKVSFIVSYHESFWKNPTFWIGFSSPSEGSCWMPTLLIGPSLALIFCITLIKTQIVVWMGHPCCFVESRGWIYAWIEQVTLFLSPPCCSSCFFFFPFEIWVLGLVVPVVLVGLLLHSSLFPIILSWFIKQSGTLSSADFSKPAMKWSLVFL